MEQTWLTNKPSSTRLTRIQREVLEVIDDGVGVTVHDVTQAMGVPLWRCRLVVAELRRQGCVAFAGENSPELVITESGVEAYRKVDVHEAPASPAHQAPAPVEEDMTWAEIAGHIRRKLNLSMPAASHPVTEKTAQARKENETD